MKITQDNNFIRIYQLPDEEDYPHGFLFAGGKLVSFLMIDWFNPYPQMEFWKHDVELTDEVKLKLEKDLIKFLKEKDYYNPACRYLAVANFNFCFIF